MSRLPKGLKRLSLALLFAVIVLGIQVLTMLLLLLAFLALDFLGVIDTRAPAGSPTAPLLIFAVFSVVVGTIVALIVSRIPLSPLREIIDAFDRLAKGDFSARIHLKGPTELHGLNTSFNNMADQLGKTEMLHSDFVNNLSHEFKTPIVSMRGFAKILRYEDLSKEERDEYLDIIISESERLAGLATDMLDLSKVENQVVLSDKARYNGSEQIRRVIVLLEGRWAKKGMEVCFDCDEIDFYGNEKLLCQVWTNLIDNAIKFSPENSHIAVSIIKKPDSVAVQIANPGKDIDPETLERVFDKFYQGDTSHASKGNGIGLAIVKKIVALHKGTVFVTSYDTETVFVVELPTAPE